MGNPFRMCNQRLPGFISRQETDQRNHGFWQLPSQKKWRPVGRHFQNLFL